MQNADPIVIVAAVRTPIGSFNGNFKEVPTTTLGATVIKAAVEKAKLTPEKVDTLFMGCVLPAGLGQAPARQSALTGGLSDRTRCTTVNKVCGSGMQAIILAHDGLLLNNATIAVAGGMENMSRAPYLSPKTRFGARLGHIQMFDHMLLDGLEDAYDKGQAMGCYAEQTATQYHLTREQQDKFALTSVQRARHAIEAGLFKEEITPVMITDRKQKTTTIDTDEGPFSVDPDKIPTLNPAFQKDGTVTAANSSSISDGAAALVLMRRSEAQRQNLPILATIVGHAAHSQQPEWFTTAPIEAIKVLLDKVSWPLDSVDLFEINEAFAVVTLVAEQQLGLDHNKVNVNGGGCILGHPIGASGARIIVTLVHALRQRQLKRGVAAICIGGGESTAIAIEV